MQTFKLPGSMCCKVCDGHSHIQNYNWTTEKVFGWILDIVIYCPDCGSCVHKTLSYNKESSKDSHEFAKRYIKITSQIFEQMSMEDYRNVQLIPEMREHLNNYKIKDTYE